MKKIMILSLVFIMPFFLNGCGKKDNEQKQENKEVNKEMSIKELKEQGIEQECKMSMDNFEYVLYIKDGKVKVENTMNGSKYYTLMDDEFVYTWTDMNNTGTKMNLNEMDEDYGDEEYEDEEDYEYESDFDFGDDYNFNCKNTSVDKEKIELPKDINFMDLSESLMQMQNGLGNMNMNENNNQAVTNQNSDLCAMCDMLEGENKEECMTNLGC